MTAEPKVALDSPVESEVLSDPEAQQDAVTASIGFSKYFEVDFSILLGIFMHLALRKPHVWIKPTAYQERKRSEELVALCHRVQDLDVFVSHCWKAPGHWKHLGLLLQHGWKHGLLGWFLLTSVCFCLQSLEVIKGSFRTQLFLNGGEYDLTLSHWPSVFGFLGVLIGLGSTPYLPLKRTSCFLDVACIHQGEPELLRRGIQNVGGILACSKELQVLYHPSNFRSLWCIFELAAYRHVNPKKPISLTPLFQVRAALVVYIWALMVSLSVFFLLSAPQDLRETNLLWFWPICLFLPWCTLVHISRINYQEKKELFRDLKNFRLDRVSCKSESDKAFIYAAIERWYGSQAKFTDMVRNELCDELMSMMQSPHLAVPYAALIGTTMTTLMAELCFELLHAGADAYLIGRVFSAWFSVAGFSFLIALNLLFYVSDRLASSRSCVESVFKTLACTLTVVFWNAIGSSLAIISGRASTAWFSFTFFCCYALVFSWTYFPCVASKLRCHLAG